MNINTLSDEDLYAAMLALTTALASRTSQDWDGDRRTLAAVIDELEHRGYHID